MRKAKTKKMAKIATAVHIVPYPLFSTGQPAGRPVRQPDSQTSAPNARLCVASVLTPVVILEAGRLPACAVFLTQGGKPLLVLIGEDPLKDQLARAHHRRPLFQLTPSHPDLAGGPGKHPMAELGEQRLPEEGPAAREGPSRWATLPRARPNHRPASRRATRAWASPLYARATRSLKGGFSSSPRRV